MKKIIGYNFLHEHPTTQKMLNVDEEHVIVDKVDFEKVVNYFSRNINSFKDMLKDKFQLTYKDIFIERDLYSELRSKGFSNDNIDIILEWVKTLPVNNERAFWLEDVIFDYIKSNQDDNIDIYDVMNYFKLSSDLVLKSLEHLINDNKVLKTKKYLNIV